MKTRGFEEGPPLRSCPLAEAGLCLGPRRTWTRTRPLIEAIRGDRRGARRGRGGPQSGAGDSGWDVGRPGLGRGLRLRVGEEKNTPHSSASHQPRDGGSLVSPGEARPGPASCAHWLHATGPPGRRRKVSVPGSVCVAAAFPSSSCPPEPEAATLARWGRIVLAKGVA